MGIQEKDLTRIFDPFFTARKNKGFGLGLSISKRIIEKHNGTIRVESTVGKGDDDLHRFARISFSGEVRGAAVGGVGGVREKILVVEDEIDMRQALSRFLTRLGYQVREAESGEQGWRAIEETMFDLVISDMAMEGLTGLGLLERVRATDATLPFIIITGVGTIESAVEAIKLGAFHYITKPFKLRDIEILVRTGPRIWKAEQEARHPASPGRRRRVAEDGGGFEQIDARAVEKG